MGIAKLRLAMVLTMTLLFGFLAGIFGLILWQYGPAMELGSALAMIVGFVVVFTLAQWYFAPSIIRWTTRMRELPHGEYAWLHAELAELSKKAGIKTPRLYLVMDGTPNAFAFGRTPNDANIAVHAGLLNALNREEVKAVVAHEVGHVKHWDVAVITLASMVPLLAYYLIVLFAGRNNNERGGALGGIAVFIGALIAQFISRLLVMYLSRTREYYADAFSAAATRSPSSLQTALAKIVYGFPRGAPTEEYKSKQAFYIADPVGAANESGSVNPEKLGRELESASAGGNLEKGEIAHAIEWEKTNAWAKFSELLGTHPLTYKRLDALEALKKDLPRVEAV
ncbi:hypothetical protein COX86_00210 [Candidatus Micrarchaeota archaeon CG_4_10_14_0_2_um_filter_60_11]|nr:MAG: hypothetical protein COU39_02910 [Candidatus Micrarchaeota archaeon CG10_big_fil_rev_8_21_14_0_10_60_32]PIO02236.1 MAG: hypothetical protein COT58_01165 [Candidatus Micrarchaeota archaeon CG09_land_8_20_14_0_10_60_16]PIZ91339.1 MAG: hypothetical protein COX86_00210 [Candidatus Micrarchaeota archaeon CG_4_10_14_0_2_um_filter_60_11]